MDRFTRNAIADVGNGSTGRSSRKRKREVSPARAHAPDGACVVLSPALFLRLMIEVSS